MAAVVSTSKVTNNKGCTNALFGGIKYSDTGKVFNKAILMLSFMRSSLVGW